MSTIFISYRRDDSEGQAGRLFDDLSERFGRDSVFMDVAGIAKGRDFRRVIDQHISSCSVVLVVIGKSWIESKDESGQRRIDKETDFVRYETSVALERDIPVIPVLIGNATMPRADQLPNHISELAYRNGVELSHARWASDVRLLIDALAPYITNQSADRKPSLSWKKLAIGSGIGVAVILASLYPIIQYTTAPGVGSGKAEAPDKPQEIASPEKPSTTSENIKAPSAESQARTVAVPRGEPATNPSALTNPLGDTTIAGKTSENITPNAEGFFKRTCGSIVDTNSNLEWVIGPNRDTTWSDARKWTDGLDLCGGGWRLPTIRNLQSLYNPEVSAGTGYFTAGAYWPAHISSLFSAIGGGSWVWSNEIVDGSNAKAINFNQGMAVNFPKTQTQYPVRAFAIRESQNIQR